MQRDAKMRDFGRGLILCLVLFSPPGCKDQDREQLRKVGALSVEHLQEISGGPHGRVGTGLEALRGSISDLTPDSRVTARLRWDKELAGSSIRARMQQPGVVELQGTLQEESQRNRAIEVAKTTTGVEQVVDLLQVAGK
jgi:hypothetical protein